MFELKILLSSGSVDHGSRIKQAWGEHVHKNINTSHPSPIPTPVSAASVVSMYIWTLIHPTPAQSPHKKKRGSRAKKRSKPRSSALMCGHRNARLRDDRASNKANGGHTIPQRETRKIYIYNGKQRERRPSGRRTQSNKGKQEGAQWRQRETRPSGKQTHHPTKGNKKRRGDKGTQDFQEGGHAIQWETTETRPSGRRTPSNQGKQEWAQWETRPFGRGTDRPKMGNLNGYNGKQGKQDPQEGGHTIHLRKHWDSLTIRIGQQWETKEDKTLGKAGTPSNKGQREGVQGDTKGRQDPRENKHPIQQKATRRGTMLGKVDTPSNNQQSKTNTIRLCNVQYFYATCNASMKLLWNVQH